MRTRKSLHINNLWFFSTNEFQRKRTEKKERQVVNHCFFFFFFILFLLCFQSLALSLNRAVRMLVWLLHISTRLSSTIMHFRFLLFHWHCCTLIYLIVIWFIDKNWCGFLFTCTVEWCWSSLGTNKHSELWKCRIIKVRSERERAREREKSK